MDIRCSKDRRSGAWSLLRLTAVGKQNSKCVFTGSDVTCPGGHMLPACLAGSHRRPVVILDNEKIMILSGVDTAYKPSRASSNRHLAHACADTSVQSQLSPAIDNRNKICEFSSNSRLRCAPL